MQLEMTYSWPECFKTEKLSDNPAHVLADQCVAWGNLHAGESAPDNFYEVMEMCSKVTGAFTHTEVSEAADRLIELLKKDKQNG